MAAKPKPARGGARPGAGRPATTGRGTAAARAITLRLSADEADALESVVAPSAVGRYLRGAGLALPQIVDALASAGDTLTADEAITVALGIARQVYP